MQANYAATEWELFRRLRSGDVISLGGFKDADKAKQAAWYHIGGYFHTRFKSVNIREDHTEVYLQHEARLFEFKIYPDRIQCKMFKRSDFKGMSSGSLEGTWEECQGSLLNMAEKLLTLVPNRATSARTRYGTRRSK